MRHTRIKEPDLTERGEEEDVEDAYGTRRISKKLKEQQMLGLKTHLTSRDSSPGLKSVNSALFSVGRGGGGNSRSYHQSPAKSVGSLKLPRIKLTSIGTSRKGSEYEP
eukprot:TRINITY_DN14150_c0_g1_i2.p1 TRINITY_DN14150_c0_g1~~TRINITY_DN14150_c0_g1_i2.p1  ORF type:complete len:108 (-),score=7.57 TRINITY_DN14150_c0_g1_i2:95-418(-)